MPRKVKGFKVVLYCSWLVVYMCEKSICMCDVCTQMYLWQEGAGNVLATDASLWPSPCFQCLHSRSPEPWQPHNARGDCSSLTAKKPHSDTALESQRKAKKEYCLSVVFFKIRHCGSKYGDFTLCIHENFKLFSHTYVFFISENLTRWEEQMG